MSVKETEEEFKLPLRQWLIKKIELRQFDGLEWLDNEKRSFKIPWTQKGHPNWQEHYQIYIAWAKHRNNYDEQNPPDDKKLKGNFRCALTKSDDFEELKKDSKTNQQMGNYKVFKLLTPDEVKAKRETRKRPRPSASSNHSSLEMPEQKKLTENNHHDASKADFKLDYAPSSMLYDPDASTVDLSQLESIQPLPLTNDEVEPSIYLHTLDTTQSTANQQSSHNPFDYFDTKILLSPEPGLINDGTYQVPASPGCSYQPSRVQIENFQEFLKKFNIPRDSLSSFTLTVYYENQIVKQETVDLSQGIRIMYSDNPQRQKAILDVFKKNVTDIHLKPWSLPLYSGANRHVKTILNSADLGIALKADSRNVLRGTRLCQSQVFFFENTEVGWRIKKMERQQRCELFSYLKYIRRLVQCQKDGVNDEIGFEMSLVIGTKPTSPRSNTLVSIVLKPVVSDLLEGHFKANDSTSLLAISQQTSLDELIRMLDNYTF